MAKAKATNSRNWLRKIYWTFAILMTAFILSIGYLWFNRVEILSDYLSRASGMDVTLDDISIGFQNITIENFTLSDESQGLWFAAKKIAVTYRLSDLFQDKVDIQKISITNGQLAYRMNLPDQISLKNLSDLWEKGSRKLTSLTSSSKSPAPQKSTEEQMVIRQLVMTNLKFELEPTGIKKGKTFSTTIPLLELKNISSDASANMRGLFSLVFQLVAQRAQQSA